jgi:hypothetical protein
MGARGPAYAQLWMTRPILRKCGPQMQTGRPAGRPVVSFVPEALALECVTYTNADLVKRCDIIIERDIARRIEAVEAVQA